MSNLWAEPVAYQVDVSGGVMATKGRTATSAPPRKEAYGTGLQPSMSWSAQILECSFAFGKELDRGEASEAARYGSAFHELAASRTTNDKRPLSARVAATRWGVGSHHAELKEHAAVAYGVLTQWLKRNEFHIDFDAIRKKGALLIEHAIALRPGVSGRAIAPHDEEHRYHGLELGEQPGTLDLAVIPHKRDIRKLPILVYDWKTGEEDFSQPLEKAQLLSLAAGTMRWVGADEAIVAVGHARRRGMPKVYADRVKLSELGEYERRIGAALAKIGDGSMRPGPWCDWYGGCPARSVCPARDAELLARAGDVLTGLTAAGGALSKDGLTANDVSIVHAGRQLSQERKLGLLYDVVRKAEALAGRARAEIKNAILASNGMLLPETPNGEYLTIREYEKENLSKSSVVEAYGKIAGERLLKKFRRDGAIRTSKVVQLWPEKDRGR